MTKILRVDGYMATIELLGCIATAARAAASAVGSIVVLRFEMWSGAMTTAWLFSTGLPAAFWISTYRPEVPLPGGASFSSRLAMLVSPASLYDVMSFPLASLTPATCGAALIAARWVALVRLGARTSAAQEVSHRLG